ncbi:MAG TPA: protein kinase [Gemmataceae bacterium]|nr:protein kinase [Gemmataceae bacterium]
MEEYLRHFPNLTAHEEVVLDLIGTELLVRKEVGEDAGLDEYLRRFPNFDAPLRRRFEILQASSRTPSEGQLPADSGSPTLSAPSALAGAAAPSERPPTTLLWGPRAETPSAPLETISTPPLAATPPVGPASSVSLAPPGYEILGELGQGGMGTVYKARQLSLGRLVALKMIRGGPHAASKDIARFRTEAEAVARMQHPNIVRIYEVGDHNGQPYFTLEFIEDGSLAARVNGTPLPALQAAELVEVLAHAMHAAHARGIVHRDLKPANILLARSDSPDAVAIDLEGGTVRYEPKITDFGLAKKLDAEAGQTHTGEVMGTPCYMAPEQATGQTREIGPPLDIYALGAILYELLTGRPPFRGATIWDTLEQVRSQEPVPPRRLQPKVPRDLETICLKCLQKDPKKRYVSAQQLADRLRLFRNGQPIPDRPTPLWERGLKWARRRPAVAALVAVSALATAGLFSGAIFYAQYQHQRAQVAEQQIRDRDRLEKIRLEARERILKGQQAMERQEWENAKFHLGEALGLVGNDPLVGEMRAEAQQLLDELVARDRTQTKYRQFLERRDKALFHATLATGEGLLANLRATREAAGQALALFGVHSDGGAGPLLDASLTDRQQAEIKAGCYELLLVLAEAVAYPVPDEPAQQHHERLRQAVRILDRAAPLGKPTKAYHLRRARYLEQLGEEAQAQRDSAQAAGLQPTTPLDHYLVGDEYSKQGKLEQAARHFELALDLQPDHFWARYFLALTYLRQQRPAEAKAVLTALAGQDADFVWTYLLRGYAHGQLKDFERAEADFQRALQFQPGPDARYVLYANRGVMRLRQGGKFEEAVDDLRRAMQLRPDQYHTHLSLAQAYRQQKEWDAARQHLAKAIELEPGLASLYRSRAAVHLERQDLAAALDDFDEVIRIDEATAAPPSTVAKDYADRGRLRYRREQCQEALADYDVALRHRPDYALAHRWRAEALVKLHRFEEALAAFEQYFKHGGKPLAEVYQQQGLAQARLGEHRQAIQDYTRAIGLRQEALRTMDRGVAPAQAAERERLRRELAATYSSRGYAYLACHASQLAHDDFQQALDLLPEDGDSLLGRGLACVQLGAYRQATADADAALRLAPLNPRLLYGAARIYAQAARLAAEDPMIRNPLTAAPRQRYLDRALDLLEGALNLSTPEEQRELWKRLRVDADFDPIRQSPAYARLAARFASSSKTD